MENNVNVAFGGAIVEELMTALIIPSGGFDARVCVSPSLNLFLLLFASFISASTLGCSKRFTLRGSHNTNLRYSSNVAANVLLTPSDCPANWSYIAS